MRDPRPERCREYRGRRYRYEAQEIDVAETARRQPRVAEAREDEAGRARQADDQAEQRGRAHRTVDRLIMLEKQPIAVGIATTQGARGTLSVRFRPSGSNTILAATRSASVANTAASTRL